MGSPRKSEINAFCYENVIYDVGIHHKNVSTVVVVRHKNVMRPCVLTRRFAIIYA
jgi:hypothetical protein